MARLTPATLRALAYCDATGQFPSHLHLGTYGAAHPLCDLVPYQAFGMTLHRLKLKPEAVEAIAAHPLKLACDWLKSRGFRYSDHGRATSHYIPFHYAGDLHGRANAGAESFTGLAYRSGGGSVTAEHGTAWGAPYRTSWQFAEIGDAWPALLRPAMYAGPLELGEHPRDYLRRALAAYQGAQA